MISLVDYGSFKSFLNDLSMRIGAAIVVISVFFGLGYVKRTDFLGLSDLLESGTAFFGGSFRTDRIFMDTLSCLPVLCRISNFRNDSQDSIPYLCWILSLQQRLTMNSMSKSSNRNKK